MIKALKKGEVVWYAPDHDTARAQAFSSLYLPLSRLRPHRNLDAGTDVRRMSGALRSTRKPDGKGYQLIMLPPECSPPWMMPKLPPRG